MILLGIVVAFGLGAMHAFSPGHGKTMVAAYLVGARGTWKHAVFLGGMVTFTHTISVFALGFVTLFLSRYILPEKLEPILGVISGITIIWVGQCCFISARKSSAGTRTATITMIMHIPRSRPRARSRSRATAMRMTTNIITDLGGHTHVPEGEVTMGSLDRSRRQRRSGSLPFRPGDLLSSIALGRIGMGITWLIGFSAGLAVVLTAIGVLVVYAKDLLPKTQSAMRGPVFRFLPVASAAIVIVIGILMTSVSLGWISPGKLLG